MRMRSAAFRALLGLLFAGVVAGCDDNTGRLPVAVSFDAVVTTFRIVDDGPDTFLLQPAGQADPYYPLNLPAAFQQENLRVRVEGLEIRDYRVLLQKPVKIYTITALPD
jgi:hypothetical protein